MSTTLNQLSQAYIITKNLRVPKEGPKSIPLQLLFATMATSLVDFDGLNVVQQNKFTMCQGLYIDNGRNGSVLTIRFGFSQQRIDIPAQTQGYMPALCPNPIKVQFQSAGNLDDCFVHLLNFPVPALLWKVA